MLKALRGLLLLGLILVVVVFGAAWLLLRASLPTLDGELVVDGLDHEVRVTRDAQGVPTVTARERLDLVRATGFLHAQERFFQMDLQRRAAAGELSELVGAGAVSLDKRRRLHQLRSRAERIVATATPNQQSVLFAYTHGVNEGLDAMLAKPFEYFLLGGEPQPWRAEDSLLVLYAMFLDLNDEDGRRESALATMTETLPPELLAFLLPPGSEWDAPLLGEAVPPVPVPGSEVIDLRQQPSHLAAAKPAIPAFDEYAVGSNSFAVDAAHGSAGAAVTGDMHLSLSVPNIWYRMRLVVDGAAQGLDAVGVTLPGVPALVAGSNGHVAWTFTNSYGDWTDLVALEFDPQDPERYRGPDGWLNLEYQTETVCVHKQESQTLDIALSIWGPVVERAGHRYAVHWLAHEAEAINLDLMRMEQAQTVDEAIVVANGAGIPPQNVLIADSAGRIAWTIAGRIPRRSGFDGSHPVAWLDGVGWDGWLPSSDYPRVVDPESGRLWTANARTVDGDALAVLGDGGYAFGARARQIRDDLMAADRFTPEDLLAIQLDDRAIWLAGWREQLLALLDEPALAGHPLRTEARDALESWGGRAAVDSVGYRVVRAWHDRVCDGVVAWLTAPTREADPDFEWIGFAQSQAALYTLLRERPMNLLDAGYDSWDAFLLQALDEVLTDIAADGGTLVGHPWGERNPLRMQHPLSRFVPMVWRVLDMPAQALPGDVQMPRVQGRDFGASQRMTLAPGREDQSLFQMPGGQSGHPLSPYYRTGHQDWVDGTPAPLLPAAEQWSLRLSPAPGS